MNCPTCGGPLPPPEDRFVRSSTGIVHRLEAGPYRNTDSLFIYSATCGGVDATGAVIVQSKSDGVRACKRCWTIKRRWFQETREDAMARLAATARTHGVLAP